MDNVKVCPQCGTIYEGEQYSHCIKCFCDLKHFDEAEHEASQAATCQQNEDIGNDHWMRIGFITFLIVGLICMGLATAILSDSNVGFLFSGNVVISNEGLAKIMWIRTIFEFIWLVLIFLMSCAAIESKGIRGFKHFFHGMVLGSILAVFAWSVGSAFIESNDRSARSIYYDY